ncbi:hypothetical protein LCGC14_2917850, partial [marine sediment metagenome]
MTSKTETEYCEHRQLAAHCILGCHATPT